MASENQGIYPWQADQWSLIQSMVSNDRLPHAMLVTGAEGIGLLDFARQFTYSLLCETPSTIGEHCQQCSSCHLLKAETHPDLLIVEPEEEGKAIKVDQVRKLVSFSQLQSHYNNKKIIIIQPAEAMNTSAANGLLKTLEEPPGDTLMLLLSHQPSTLPITVRSRCQKIKISASSSQVKAWLTGKVENDQLNTILAAGYGPLYYEKLVEDKATVDRSALLGDLDNLSLGKQDPIETADIWSKNPTHEMIFWLLKLIQDLIKLKSANETDQLVTLVNNDLRNNLQQVSERYQVKEIFTIYDKLFEYHRLISANTTVKPTTMLEDISIEWANLRKK